LIVVAPVEGRKLAAQKGKAPYGAFPVAFTID
jgi:hypothetical protein